MHLSRFNSRVTIIAIAAVLILALIAPMASYASPQGNRNTAIGLAGIAAYMFMKGKTVPGLAAAAAAGYAYNRSQNERNDRSWYYRNHRDYRSRDRYHSYSHSRYDNDNRLDRDYHRR